MRRPIGWLAVLLVVGSTNVACAGSEDPAPIRVGAIYPLSGSQGPGGLEEYHGVAIAAELVNADGGVDGRAIRLVPIDVPRGEGASAAVGDLASRGVRLVVGSYGSTISVPAAAEAQRRGMLFWETGAVGEMASPTPADLVFRVPPTGLFLGARAIAFVADRLAASWGVEPGSLRIAIAFVNDVYGRSVARGAEDEIARRGLDLVGRFGYDPRASDLSAVVRKVGAADADVFFVAAYVRDGIELRRLTIDQGLRLHGMIGTSSSYCMPAFGRALGPDAVGVFASDKPDEVTLDADALTSASAAVLARGSQRYRARYHEDMSAAALAGFAAGWALFHDVLGAAEGVAPEDVAASARATDIPMGGLPNGSGLRFGATGTPEATSNLRAASVIEQWAGGEEPVVVWPDRFVERPVPLVPLGP
jgi:branched-chain amino acid transport system substrate-binding protein